MAGHTPGPWKTAQGTSTGMVVVAPDQPKVRYSVAACGGQNREANARLIAAAPDLLVALEDALPVLDMCGEFDVWDAARAAIARASSSKGGEQ